MKFFVDEQLPVSLARWLRESGHDAGHIHELGLRSAADLAISERVADVRGVIVTKDSDFIELRRRQPEFQVLWLRVGNVGTSQLLARLEGVWPDVLQALLAGDPVVEVR